MFLRTPKHTYLAFFTWEALCAWCVTCLLLPVLAMGAAWNSLSPVGVLTNPKPLGLVLLSGPQQYNPCVFCDCLIHLLPDIQQWKKKMPSTDKPSLRAATFPLLSRWLWLQWEFTLHGLKYAKDALVSGTAQVTWKAACRSEVALHRGGRVTRPCRTRWHVLVCPGTWCWHGAGEQGGDRGSGSQYHCLFLKVATVWCSCVVAQFQPR